MSDQIIIENNRSKECGSCKHFEQGEKSSFCGNPKQTDVDLKAYAWYNFKCDLYQLGIAQSRIDHTKSHR